MRSMSDARVDEFGSMGEVFVRIEARGSGGGLEDSTMGAAGNALTR